MKINLLALFIVPLPSRIKIWILNLSSKNYIHSTAKIGFSYLDATYIQLGEHAVIGHFNIVKNLESFKMGAHARISNSNFFKGEPLGTTKHFKDEPDRDPSFSMGDHSIIAKRNYFDCCNKITIGNFVAIAGFNTTVLTHDINVQTNRQESAPTSIGDHCRIGIGCVLFVGSKLPSYSFLGANSTLVKAYDEEYVLYSGVPAVKVRELDKHKAYFKRTSGFVD